MAHFFIVGKSFSTLGNYLESHGHSYTVLVDSRNVKTPRATQKNRVVLDFSNTEKLVKSVRDLAKQSAPDGVLVTYENYVLPAAQLAAALDLPGLPVEAASACTDKFQMRHAFAKSPEPISPDFEIVRTEQDVLDFARSHRYPLILKPANLAKSLLVTKSTNEEELVRNYRRTLQHIQDIYDKYAPDRQPKVIIEEFLEGTIHSVDAFVDSDGVPHVLQQVVDYQTGYDIGYDDNFHYSRILPSKLPEEDIEAIRHCAEIGCRVLGMKNSPAHIEIILTSKGPRIVEIGARNGGYRERMHRLANGIDITGNALKLALGQKPDIRASRNESCAVLELFPKQPGFFKGIENEEKLKQLSSFVYFSQKHGLGEFVGKSSDGYKMCAVIILHNSDSAQFEQDLTFVNDNIFVNTTARS